MSASGAGVCRLPLMLIAAVAGLVACARAPQPLVERVEPRRVDAGPVVPAPRHLPPRVRIVGAPAPFVLGLLGEPSLRRRDPPAEYWRYTFPNCTLDLFLFADGPFAEPRVVYYEFRSTVPVAGAGLNGCHDMRARFDTRQAPEPDEGPSI
ncbi:hypothetical protein HRbin39_00010 [bacterium HR39]|nr:hypothetical protein HRbin39_00010 [bacterium HR39]